MDEGTTVDGTMEQGMRNGGTTDGRSTADRPTEEDAMDEGLSQIRERAEAIRDEEVARACSQLAADGELSQRRQAAVEELAERLVEHLLAVPARGLAAAEEQEDVAQTVRELFDGDGA